MFSTIVNAEGDTRAFVGEPEAFSASFVVVTDVIRTVLPYSDLSLV
jgi:hypothetical protein